VTPTTGKSDPSPPRASVQKKSPGSRGSLYEAILVIEIVRRPLLCPGKVGGHEGSGFGVPEYGPLAKLGQIDGSSGAPQRSPKLQGNSFVPTRPALFPAGQLCTHQASLLTTQKVVICGEFGIVGTPDGVAGTEAGRGGKF
jgi:hypothetical protein